MKSFETNVNADVVVTRYFGGASRWQISNRESGKVEFTGVTCHLVEATDADDNHTMSKVTKYTMPYDSWPMVATLGPLVKVNAGFAVRGSKLKLVSVKLADPEGEDSNE